MFYEYSHYGMVILINMYVEVTLHSDVSIKALKGVFMPRSGPCVARMLLFDLIAWQTVSLVNKFGLLKYEQLVE